MIQTNMQNKKTKTNWKVPLIGRASNFGVEQMTLHFMFSAKCIASDNSIFSFLFTVFQNKITSIVGINAIFFSQKPLSST